jgi:ATP-dependent metalloprotease
MVTEAGMSPLGNVDFSRYYDTLSSETREKVEIEVRKLVEESHARATALLISRRKELELLAKALVEYETLNKAEMEKVIRGEKLPERDISSPTTPIKLPEGLLPNIIILKGLDEVAEIAVKEAKERAQKTGRGEKV